MTRQDDDKDTVADDEGRALDEQIARYLKIGLPIATAVCAVVAGVLQGPAAVVLVLAASALCTVIAIFWASMRTLVGETPLSGADAYALGAPRAEEEQKRAVLRALKDLEFEHSVGKISEEDYQALKAKYRAEGKRLIRLIDEDAQPRRQKIEALVAERLVREGLAERPAPAPYRAPEPGKKKLGKKKSKPAPVAEEIDTRPTCASCGTRNDPDAVFCKKCGARQRDEVPEEEGEGSAEVKAEQESTS
jgi:hypothetical protein